VVLVGQKDSKEEFMKAPLSIHFAVAIACALLLVAGCQPKTQTPSETTVGDQTTRAPAGEDVAKRDRALVRLVNAREDQVDIYFGELKAFDRVDSQNVTSYSELPAERHDLKVFHAGSADPPIASNSEGLNEGDHYTAVAVKNKDGSAGLTLFKDDLSNPSNGKARIRIINAATGVDEVDVFQAGNKDSLVSGVNFNSATGYKEVDPTIMTLEIRKKGDKQPSFRISDLNLAAGKTYTIIVLNGPNAIRAVSVEDRLVA
jgi:hypothetical protein